MTTATMTLDEAWKAAEEALPEGSDYGVSFAANGPDAGWYATALLPAMSNHIFVGPLETQITALQALTAKIRE